MPEIPVQPHTPQPTPSQKGMNWKKILIGVVILVTLLGVGLAIFIYRDSLRSLFKNQTEESSQQIEPSQEVTSISAAHNAFGFDILKELQSEDKSENIFISPSSISLALSMTYNGADGETKSAMAKTLRLPNFSIEQVNQSSRNLLSLLDDSDSKVQIDIANSIWARKGVEFKQSFLNVNQKYYSAKVTTLDFSKEDAVDVMNKWVNDNTNGKIPTIITPPINPLTVMFLINAIYFNGTWTYEFDSKLTEERQFTSFDGSKHQKPMMHQTREDFSYLETDDFQAVELPYGDKKRLGMYAFLPKKDFTTFFNRLTSDDWNSWVSKFKAKEGTLILPKFKIEYGKELNDSLKKLGMGVAFESADFSKMSNDPRLLISQVLHKSFIDVNEEGTEAAAATSVEMTFGSVGPEEKDVFSMEVNKPFFFAITDKETNEIIFMGLVKNIP